MIRKKYRIVQFYKTADGRKPVAEWLHTPDRSLGMKAPLNMLTTDIGTAKVENLAKAMIHGVPA